jgi:hypothetical protein
MCASGATRLPLECCFSELAQQKPNLACWSSTMRTLSSHRNVTCCLFDIVGKLPVNCDCVMKNINKSGVLLFLSLPEFMIDLYPHHFLLKHDAQFHSVIQGIFKILSDITGIWGSLRLINREAVYEKRKTRLYKYNMFKNLIHSL